MEQRTLFRVSRSPPLKSADLPALQSLAPGCGRAECNQLHRKEETQKLEEDMQVLMECGVILKVKTALSGFAPTEENALGLVQKKGR